MHHHQAAKPFLAPNLSTPAWPAALALALALLTGCERAPHPAGEAAEWMPLAQGRSHTYRVTTVAGDAAESGSPEVTEWTLASLGPGPLTGWEGQTIWLRHHSEGVTYFLQASDQGIRRVATQADIDAEPTADPEPRWVLKAPIRVGTEWTTPTVPYLLARKNEYPRELKHTHKLPMTWRIDRVDDTVTTPAGTHSPCLRVEGQGELNLYTDPVNGFRNVPIVGREWYCKGVGLVKFEREEAVPKGFMTGGRITAEWVR